MFTKRTFPLRLEIKSEKRDEEDESIGLSTFSWFRFKHKSKSFSASFIFVPGQKPSTWKMLPWLRDGERLGKYYWKPHGWSETYFFIIIWSGCGGVLTRSERDIDESASVMLRVTANWIVKCTAEVHFGQSQFSGIVQVLREYREFSLFVCSANSLLHRKRSGNPWNLEATLDSFLRFKNISVHSVECPHRLRTHGMHFVVIN